MSCIRVPHSCLCSLWIHSCTSLAFLQLEMLNISSHVLWHNCSIRSRWVCLAMPEFLFLFVLGSLPSWQVKGRAPTWPCAVWWWPSASCSCSSSWRVSLSVPSSRTWNTLCQRRMEKPHQVSSHTMDSLSSGGHPCRWTSISDHNPDEMCLLMPGQHWHSCCGRVSVACLSFRGSLFFFFFTVGKACCF